MTWTTFEVGQTAGHVRGDGDELAVVLHGGAGLSDYTEGLAGEVYDAGGGALRVARYRQRTTEPFTIAQLVDDMVEVLDHFGAPQAVVVGHSWGGHLAMHAAVARPDRVRAVVSVDALGAVGDGGAGTMDGVIMGRIGGEAVAKLATVTDPLEQLRLRWSGYFKDPAAAPPMPPIEYDLVSAAPLMTEAFRLLEEGFLERELPKLDIPSLHIIGRHSPIEPAANEKTAALMKGAVVEWTDTGHFMWIEEPGAIAAAVGRFLATL